MIGQKQKDTNPFKTRLPDYNPVSSGLERYSGPWTQTEAAHLLRRTSYGANLDQLKSAIDQGMDSTIEILLEVRPEPEYPVNYFYTQDPDVPIGSTWIDKLYSSTTNFIGYRRRSFAGYLLKNIYEEGMSITEKMITFWHNHFVTSSINDPKFDYYYFLLIRNHALGNFREFVKEMTINPSMLRYLNGNQNTKNAPNENYARELLELFTIGKGDLAGPGDYTNYTEEDISEIARVLTGWKDLGYLSKTNPEVGSFFRANHHDKDTKTLSHRFNNTTILNGEAEEYKQLIDIIFKQKEVARFICRKLYRWFVYHIIDDSTEAAVIEPLADMLEQSDFEIKPVLEALLKSQHFYDFINNGCLIKNPLDFMFSTMKSLEIPLLEENLNSYYSSFYSMYLLAGKMQMEYGDPPSVAGWKAYYQQPSYYEIWINSVTLPYRMDFTRALCNNGIKIGSFRIKVKPLDLLAKLDDPSDINTLISAFVLLLFPQDITDNQKQYLKDVLIPGLPDYEWTVEYLHYLNNLDDENTVLSMENKMKAFLDAMLTMPEFYLS